MDKTLSTLRVMHISFIATWFLFLVVIKASGPQETFISADLPIAFGLAGLSEVGLALFLRNRYISGACEILRSDPGNQAALAKWRVGNLLSFVFAETITLFGLVLKFIGASWQIALPFFAAGLVLLLLWAPRKVQDMPRGVR